ncbi:MAG: hypothetical protein ACRDFB_09920 [Rhabdochlamydiaceae bacterium]
MGKVSMKSVYESGKYKIHIYKDIVAKRAHWEIDQEGTGTHLYGKNLEELRELGSLIEHVNGSDFEFKK